MENEAINQLHGSTSHEEAEREISFFFHKQQTLAVIKPDAMEEHKGPLWSFRATLKRSNSILLISSYHNIFNQNHMDFLISLFPLSEKILEEIHTSGFSVTQLKETVLSREMAEEFYKEHREKPFFSQLVEFMCRLVCPRAHTHRRGSSSHPCCCSKFYQHL